MFLMVRLLPAVHSGLFGFLKRCVKSQLVRTLVSLEPTHRCLTHSLTKPTSDVWMEGTRAVCCTPDCTGVTHSWTSVWTRCVTEQWASPVCYSLSDTGLSEELVLTDHFCGWIHEEQTRTEKSCSRIQTCGFKTCLYLILPAALICVGL